MDEELYRLTIIIFGSISGLIGLIVFITRANRNWDEFWKNRHFRKYLWHKNKLNQNKKCFHTLYFKKRKDLMKYRENKYEERIRNIINVKSREKQTELRFLYGKITRKDISKKIQENHGNNELRDIEVSEVSSWPYDLSSLNWINVKGLKKSTPFKGDMSSYKIHNSVFENVNVSGVTQWPKNLSGINWEGVKGLNCDNTPFKEDVSSYDMSNSKLKGIDISNVNSWYGPLFWKEYDPEYQPGYLSGIRWEGAILKGDISHINLMEINRGILKGINVSGVKKWPKHLCNISWKEIVGLNSNNTPFKGDMSSYKIHNSNLKGLNISNITKWPKSLDDIFWRGAILKGNISKINLRKINCGNLEGIDVSNVEIWPNNFSSINLEGVNRFE